MTTLVFSILIAALALGLLLIITGRRGFRVNRHPVCRDCRFDLDGIYPQQSTCPECGASLKRAKSVRIGVRRRFPALVVLGALLVLLTTALLGIALYAAVTGTDLNKHKPIWLLAWEAPRASAEQGKAIADELLARLKSATLPTEDAAAIVDCALTVQARDASPWHEIWGDIVEIARSRPEGLTGAQLERFQRHAVRLKLSARPAVRAGDVLPIAITMKEMRIGSESYLVSPTWLASCELDGEPLLPHADQGPAAPLPPSHAPLKTLLLIGSYARRGSSGIREECRWLLRVPEGLDPGKRTLSVSAVVRTTDGGQMEGVRFDTRMPAEDDPPRGSGNL